MKNYRKEMKRSDLEANLISSNVCRVATVSQVSVMKTPYVSPGEGDSYHHVLNYEVTPTS